MSDGVKSIEDRAVRNEAPRSAISDQASMQQAGLDPVQISLKDICDRYNRLILQRPQRRTIWSRLFG
jgi:hypothetical protein